tara:strand:- start:1305 stop:1472 length:168 start_codon:yes stop_codon:yes gene_type:complete
MSNFQFLKHVSKRAFFSPITIKVRGIKPVFYPLLPFSIRKKYEKNGGRKCPKKFP